MKRYLAVILAATMLLLVAGCGKKAAVPTTAPGDNSTPAATSPNDKTPAPNNIGNGNDLKPETAPATTGGGATAVGGSVATGKVMDAGGCKKTDVTDLKVEDTGNLCALKVTLNEDSFVTKGPPTGYMYLLVRITITNNADGDYTINTTDHFKLETPEGKTSSFNLQAATQRSPRLQGTLGKGQTITGWLGFMPKATKGTYKFSFVHPDLGTVTWNIPR